MCNAIKIAKDKEKEKCHKNEQQGTLFCDFIFIYSFSSILSLHSFVSFLEEH